MYRSRKTTMAYRTQNGRRPIDATQEGCPYCNLDQRPILEETETMRVFPNKYPYDYWDNRGVIEHLLLVPNRHVERVEELTDAEKAEAINLMGKYEAAGYSVYWRNQDSSARSVPHQHTHLIKLNNKSPSFVFYLKKPYLIWRG
jgi:ATP adenylyltransferase